jgi:putative transposase
MQPAAFEQWCRRLGLHTETRDLLARLRSAPPARRVQGRAHNVSGAYASRKMGRTIQFESHTVELWAIYTMEYDPQVLEFFDQPNVGLKLRYLGPSGRPATASHTPDFLVLRQGEASLEEWKTEERLRTLVLTQPGRYQQTEAGGWRCPPGEAAAQALGLTYRVRSAAELTPTAIRNLILLEDYWYECVVADQIASLILERVRATPGVRLSTLLRETAAISVDAVFALLARNLLYADLAAALLVEHPHVQLYPDQPTAEAHRLLGASPTAAFAEGLPGSGTIALTPNTPLEWNGQGWTLLNLGKTTTTLQPDRGLPVELPSAYFLHLVETHTITIQAVAPTSALETLSTQVQEQLTTAGPDALAVANRRYRLVQAYQHGPPERYEGTPPRTIRDWVARFREAEVVWGCGYVGLLPHTRGRGNRTPKAPERARRLLDEAIEHLYERPKQQTVHAVYVAYQGACLAEGLQPLAERTFYRRLASRRGPEQTEQRQGKRAAYQETPWHWELLRTTARHGDRPWEVVHLDHTQLDIELVSGFGQPLGRPWATFLVDAYSRRLLAVYLTFDPPSYRSCMMALRVCVRRYGRLPQMLIVDGGKEFHSVYFESLVARYGGHKKSRPWAEPHFGSVIERLFGTTNTQFLYNLLGNTQASKQPRQMTRAVDPKRLAAWTLPDLYAFLCEWAYEIYDQEEHPALLQSPREAYAFGMARGGQREHRRVLYDDAFIKATLPSTRRGTALVQAGKGITIHYLSYWNEVFRRPEVVRTQVNLRYDPFDISRAYAYVRGRWVECVTAAAFFGSFQGHSERELELAAAELRAQNRRTHRADPITATRLAAFLAKIEAHEAVLLQRLRDQENRAVLWAIEGSPSGLEAHAGPAVLEEPPPHERAETARSPLPPVDLTALQVYEEYQ